MSKTNKVVLNGCYGGFGVSEKGLNWMIDNGLESKYYHANPDYDPNGKGFFCRGKYYLDIYEIPRHHPLLVKCVETLGSEANGDCAQLYIVEILGNLYRIDEYDGNESIETPDILDWTMIEPELSNKQSYGKTI